MLFIGKVLRIFLSKWFYEIEGLLRRSYKIGFTIEATFCEKYKFKLLFVTVKQHYVTKSSLLSKSSSFDCIYALSCYAKY